MAVNCKICGGEAPEAFSLPRSKKTGHPIPDLPNDCPYYRCTQCNFLFSQYLDKQDLTGVYDDLYWEKQDPDWYGRVGQTLRLVMLGNSLLKKQPDEIEILDFGCGPNGFVEKARGDLSMRAWGTDIIPPKFAAEWFLSPVDRQFDLVVACEVVEHLPFPMDSFSFIRSVLKPHGVFAFQTAFYDPVACDRDWWYLGPDNGHISLYSREALDHAFTRLDGRHRVMWDNYPGVQAWQF